MLGQLTEVMSMDDVQVLYPKERIMLYGINSNFDWTSVGHSLRCGSLGLETSTLNSFVDADRRSTDPYIYDKTLWPQHRLRPPNFGLL